MEELLKSLVKLKKTMLGLEADLGISDLSEVDKTLLFSITEVCEVNGDFSSKHLRQHELVKTFQVPAIIGHSNRFKKVDSSKSQKPNLVRSISSLQSSLDPKNKH